MNRSKDTLRINTLRINGLLSALDFAPIEGQTSIWRRSHRGYIQTIYLQTPICGNLYPEGVGTPTMKNLQTVTAGRGLGVFEQIGVVLRSLNQWVEEKLLFPPPPRPEILTTHHILRGLGVLKANILDAIKPHAMDLIDAAANHTTFKVGTLTVAPSDLIAVLHSLNNDAPIEDLMRLWSQMCGFKFFELHPHIRVVVFTDESLGCNTKVLAIRTDGEETSSGN